MQLYFSSGKRDIQLYFSAKCNQKVNVDAIFCSCSKTLSKEETYINSAQSFFVRLCVVVCVRFNNY